MTSPQSFIGVIATFKWSQRSQKCILMPDEEGLQCERGDGEVILQVYTQEEVTSHTGQPNILPVALKCLRPNLTSVAWHSHSTVKKIGLTTALERFRLKTLGICPIWCLIYKGGIIKMWHKRLGTKPDMQTLARDVHSTGHLQYSSIPRLQHPVSQWERLHARLEKCDKCQWRDLWVKFWVFWGVEQSQKISSVKSGQVSGRIYASFFLYGRYPTNVWYQHWV